MIAHVPAYELHHAVDIAKRAGEVRPPIPLRVLSERARGDGGCGKRRREGVGKCPRGRGHTCSIHTCSIHTWKTRSTPTSSEPHL